MTDSPTGTVAFLFTDVEGSSALWDRDRDAMAASLARHDAILREAIGNRGGRVFKTVGDAFCAAFGNVPDALVAAVEAQRVLAAEPWPVADGLCVRMAVHAGTARLADGDYLGPPLNRVARLCGAGHGGQIIVSQAAADLAWDALPEMVDLRDLGEHRLKDLVRPERVYQVVAPGLEVEFPPLETLDRRAQNLPVQRTPLVGREKEIEQVAEILLRDDVALLTLTGPGGIGKTRLALQLAAELVDRFGDGVVFVPLAQIGDPALVASAIARPFGIRESAHRPLTDALADHLRGKELLLLLDNFEHVVGAAPLLAELLSGCPRLKILVTSRTVLHLHDEHEFPVPPLEVPGRGRVATPERLSEYGAVELFIQRAWAVEPDFRVTSENAPAVAEICGRLEGLPLAIELAAARIKVLPSHALLDRLGDRLGLLTGGARDLPARQRTLRATIEWSHDLLDPVEQAVFRRLGAFVGGFTLEAAEVVCATVDDDSGIHVVDSIASLVDDSLARQMGGGTEEEEPRLSMLETIREFAMERLAESGELDAVERAHGLYFQELAERAEPHLLGPDMATWLERLDRELGNVRAALGRSLAEGRNPDSGARLAGNLWRFWWIRGYLREGMKWLETSLEARDAVSPGTRAKALLGAGNLAWLLEQGERGIELSEAALEAYRELGDQRGVVYALSTLAIATGLRGVQSTVKEERDRVLRRSRAITEECLGLALALDEKWLGARMLNILGENARAQGDLDRAGELYGQALTVNRQLFTGPSEQAVTILLNLGIVAASKGRVSEAGARWTGALEIARELGDKRGIASAVAFLAGIRGLAGQHDLAARLQGASEAIQDAIGWHIEPLDRRFYDNFLAQAREGADQALFEVARAEGRSIPLDDAVALALESAPVEA